MPYSTSITDYDYAVPDFEGLEKDERRAFDPNPP
jgi:hypothetical protein